MKKIKVIPVLLGITMAVSAMSATVFAAEASLDTGSSDALDTVAIEESIEADIVNSFEILDENGSTVADASFTVDVCDVQVTDDGYRANVIVDLILPDSPRASGSYSDTYYDPTSSVRLNLTVYYTSTTINGATYSVLTRFSGSYSILQSGVSLSLNRIRYATSGTGPSGYVSQSAYYYVSSSSFSKTTGFSNYVLNSAGVVGAAWTITMNRGGNSYTYTFSVCPINNAPF